MLSDHFEVCAFSEAKTHSLVFSKALTTQLLQQANSGFNTDINDLLLAALARALSGTFDSAVNHIPWKATGASQLLPILMCRKPLLVHEYVSGAVSARGIVAQTIIETKEMLRSAQKASDSGQFCLRSLIGYRKLALTTWGNLAARKTAQRRKQAHPTGN